MNATQRKIMVGIYSQLEQSKSDLENLQSELQDAFDERFDKWRESDKGEAEAEIISELETAAGEVESAMDRLSNIGLES